VCPLLHTQALHSVRRRRAVVASVPISLVTQPINSRALAAHYTSHASIYRAEQRLRKMPKLLLDPEPVQRGRLLWTWDGTLKNGMLSSFPVRMVIAGYTLGSTTCLVVISPLQPTKAVTDWVSSPCHLRPMVTRAVLAEVATFVMPPASVCVTADCVG